LALFTDFPSPLISSRSFFPLEKNSGSGTCRGTVWVSKFEKNQAGRGSRQTEKVRDELAGLFDFAWRFS
jgi:hypothetical protein